MCTQEALIGTNQIRHHKHRKHVIHDINKDHKELIFDKYSPPNMEYQYYKINYQDKYNASSHVTSLRKPNASILEKDNHKHNYTAGADHD